MQGCVTPHAGQLGYEDFDTGLIGVGFPDALANCSLGTLLGATCSEQLDPNTGKTCPGALRLSTAFKSYASGTANDENAFLNLEFSLADWRQATALHAWVKVSPASAPLSGVQLYVIAGDGYKYASIFDSGTFRSGNWYEMVFRLAEADLDLTKVRRMGVRITLNRAGTPGIPDTPPPIDVLVDDVWLEP
jgi:hypothetical protein